MARRMQGTHIRVGSQQRGAFHLIAECDPKAETVITACGLMSGRGVWPRHFPTGDRYSDGRPLPTCKRCLRQSYRAINAVYEEG